MSEETPGSTGGTDDTPPPEPPTQPTDAAPASPPPPPAGTGATGARAPFHLVMPRWVAVVVAALLVFGVGFGIGWIARGGGGSHDEIQIGGGFPRSPGGAFVPGGGQGPAAPQVPGTSTGAFLGVSTQAPSSGQQGVSIAAVQPGSPADQAGVKAGDLVTAVDGNAVTSPAQLSQDIRAHQPGDQVTVTYTRSGTSAQVQVKLGTRTQAQTG